MNQLLVVDDDPQVLIALDETLKRKGYSVTTAGNAIEVLSKLRDRDYQLIISDVRMPNINGVELLRRVRAVSPSTPVVLLTAFGTVQNAVEAMKLGAFDYLLKPFTSEALEGVVKKALASAGPSRKPSHTIATQDPTMRQILDRMQQAAKSEATVLIQAESGTGKELLARYIHEHSPRNSKPFVAVNCAALPENLLESELFGYEKGAFTGANSNKPGKFELADKGTILLDEIGEMAPILQAKILRVLQEKEVDRVGGTRPIHVDVRVISTTNKDLSELVRQDKFRQDLFYRLNVIPLKVPPLRQRKEDIPLLVDHFCHKYGSGNVRFSNETVELLRKYDWPGNVRELENIVQRAIALTNNPTIAPADLFMEGVEADKAVQLKVGTSIKELEQRLIAMTLEETKGNRTHAAKLLGISLRTLRNKLREYRIQGLNL